MRRDGIHSGRRCGRSRAPARVRRVVRDAGAWRDAWAALWVSRLVVWAAGAMRRGAVGPRPRASTLFDPGAVDAPVRPGRQRARRAAGALGQRLVPGDRQRRLPGRRPAPRRVLPAVPAAAPRGRRGRGLARSSRARSSRSCASASRSSSCTGWPSSSSARRAARMTVWALALYPGAVFFSAVYSEALYLASVGRLSLRGADRPVGVGGVLGGARRRDPQRGRAARRAARGHVARAGATGGRAARATRPGSRSCPAGLAALLRRSLALGGGDAFAPVHAQDIWFRHFAGPFVGVWDGDARRRWQRRCTHLGDAGGARRRTSCCSASCVAAVPMVVATAAPAAARLRRLRRSRRSRCRCRIRSARSRSCRCRASSPCCSRCSWRSARGWPRAGRPGGVAVARAVGRRARRRQRRVRDLALGRVRGRALLDALGTLVELERPWPHLVAELRGARRRGERGRRAAGDARRDGVLQAPSRRRDATSPA